MTAQYVDSWLNLPMPITTSNVIQVDIVQHDAIPWIAIVSAIVAMIAAVIAWRNLAAARSKLQVDGILNLTRESGSHEFQDAVKTLLTLNYLSATAYIQAADAMTEESRTSLAEQLLLVTQFFDKVGYFVRQKYLDELLIQATYGVYIVEVWEHTKGILTTSQITDKDLFPNNFKWLAERAKLKIKPFSEEATKDLAARLKRIADGTATPEDRVFR